MNRNDLIGKKCYITENVKNLLGLPDGIVFEICDILDGSHEFNIVLKSKELGKDYVEFFDVDEIILIEN